MTTILLILEGERTEPNVLKNLETCFFTHDDKKQRISLCFKTDIFGFYDALKDEDGFLDPFSVLKERNPEACPEIKSSEEISAIYLFFDHDIHVDRRMTYPEKSKKIEELLGFFNNETENGLLLISYPMFEAYKDWNKTSIDCLSCLTDTTDNTHYKEKVRSRHAAHDNQAFFNFDNWNSLSRIMISKSLFLVVGNHADISYDFVQNIITQLSIFKAQNQKFVLDGFVAIISSIPFFLCIELGRSYYNRHIKDSLQHLDCKYYCIAQGTVPNQLL